MNRNQKMGFSIMMLIAFFMRLYNLGEECFAHDELGTLEYSREGIASMFVTYMTNTEPYTPYYYMLLHSISSVFGEVEFYMRFPSIIAGVLSLGVFFTIARRFYDYNIALCATSLMVVSPTHMFYSQEMRPYIFIFLFSTLMLKFSLDFVDRKTEIQKNISDYIKQRHFWIFLLSSIALAHLHYFGMYLVIFVFCSLFFLGEREHRNKILLLLVLTLVSYAPWYYKTYLHFFHSPNNTWLPEISPLQAVESVLGFYFKGRYHKVSFVFTLFFLIGAGGLVWGKGIFRNRKIALWLCVWIFLPIILVLIKSEFTHPSFHKRYFIIGMTPAFLCLFGLVNFFSASMKRYLSLFIVSITLLGHYFSYEFPYWEQKNCQEHGNGFGYED